MKNNTKILICNENAEERSRLIKKLAEGGYERCDFAEDGERALEMIKTARYDIVITDLWLSGIDGIGIIRSGIKLTGKDKPSFILTSPINKQAILVEATEAGADLCGIGPMSRFKGAPDVMNPSFLFPQAIGRAFCFCRIFE